MKLFERLLVLLENVLLIFGGICLFLLMIAVVADSGGRYFFNAPISGVYEISEFYFMISIVFLALAHTQRQKGHVRVRLLIERMPYRWRVALDVFFYLAAAVVFACITYVTARNGWDNIVHSRWTTGVVQIPTGPSWLIVSAGSGVFTIRLVFDALILATSPEDPDDGSDLAAYGADTEHRP